ncbi:hypothetical protein IMSHALPRED_002820 [Imshaugia aleurites]|uniref:Uncharacterized protein n=1 Tax=Imshaugia aleurites TaxID=172621 RepID=A0A8H3J6N1_9LECA|nr:hypothetical protein IMSHALPRED_002820 [Imshaugia aleurites]
MPATDSRYHNHWRFNEESHIYNAPVPVPGEKAKRFSRGNHDTEENYNTCVPDLAKFRSKASILASNQDDKLATLTQETEKLRAAQAQSDANLAQIDEKIKDLIGFASQYDHTLLIFTHKFANLRSASSNSARKGIFKKILANFWRF